MNLKSLIIMAITTAATLCSCGHKNNQPTENTLISGINPSNFETTYVDSLRGARQVHLYTLRNANGMEVAITNFGARIVSIMVPDRNGEMKDVVLGFDNATDFFPQNHSSDFGAIIGRYANRLNQGQITINDTTYQLPQNNGPHTLHGGPTGWQYQVFQLIAQSDNQLTLAIDSPHLDNGFPGNVQAQVVYTLTDNNALEIQYSATTDHTTVINMTNHAYFNLSGDGSRPITDHLLTINADQYTPIDSTFMTTGEKLPVEDTPMDFRQPKAVGAEIENFDFQQLRNGNGYDHNFILLTAGDSTRPAATLLCPSTGIQLQVFTTEPGLQVYTGNFLDGTVTGKHNIAYPQRSAICLETQKYPDSPNKNWTESNAYLAPDQTYQSFCRFQFSVVK